ncbi:L,D-transpeptidase family protein [Zunongwangia sp. F363]|uniref:L,D-transpeptidase family protein n=1 Tax=Autumnicola tepida TaxID=3075595 RepID=A0ABU3C5T6_9FLAO|nr:L,D-transpeptidase family protein [Zunongwangia sp. F363]MDT0641691.1 L,D-transpeptidase family protein [Zunongwangia sp. F363]
MFSFRVSFLTACVLFTFLSCKNEKEKDNIEADSTPEDEQIGLLAESQVITNFFSDSTETGKLNLSNTKAVADFYQSKNYSPVWKKAGLRKELYKDIQNISEEGLNPADYHAGYLKNSLADLSNLDEQARGRLEIILTDSFYTLLHDLYYGKLNPKEIFEIWDVKKESINIQSLIQKALANEEITEVLNSVKPKHPVYNGLKKSLAEFESASISEEKFTSVKEGKIIKPGEDDPRIPSVVKRLKELGFSVEKDSTTTVYVPAIQEAVKKFQQEYGLELDGIIGSSTVRNLNKTKEDRRQQILANLERWRWFPRQFGNHYIIVNIPNFELSVVREGDTLSKHKVMVGVQARKTPVFSDEIEYVVYNPTWTIPLTIKKNDVIPGAAKDISYLRNRNLKIYNSAGETVDPSGINWSSGEALNYTYRQEAGSTNPLGRVKIIYPNQYLIYLHDTPSKALFEKNSRAQSSGCVRVQDAIGLSKYLLSNRENYSSEKIDSIIASGRTNKIAVTQPVKVYHLYWTAWRENNNTHFTEDIYNTDNKISQLLKK